jgi:hypothetical protein
MSEECSRRRFLGVVGAVGAAGLAGCGSASGDDATERELSLTLSREDGPLRENHVVELPADEEDVPWDAAAFGAARDGEDYTTEFREPFFSDPDDPVYVLWEGTYYRCGSVVVDEVTATRPVLRLFDVESRTATPVDDPVDTATLSRADQRAVRVAHMAARARGNEGGVPWGLVQRGGAVLRSEDSAFLTGDAPDQVGYRGSVYAVEVTEERFHGPVYRATVEPIAESPERMESVLRATFVDADLSRADLSREARDVLREAETEGYAESHPHSAAYEEVLRAMHARAYIDGNIRKDAGGRHDGRRMLRYDGSYFDYTLRFVSTGD